MNFSEADYNRIHELTFGRDYPGYKPTVQESPNGDGDWDQEKRYAHVAAKYLGPDEHELEAYLTRAWIHSTKVVRKLGLDPQWEPSYAESCLRILDYPPGAGSAEHTDFDFLTIQLFRDRPEGFVRTEEVDPRHEEISPGIHFGEIAEEIGFAKATPHYVKPLNTRQRSIVFFALPHRHVALKTVGEWLDERKARSRREIG